MTALGLSAGALAKRPAPLFRGDFETGNLRQWHVQEAAPRRVRLVRRPRAEGRYAAAFTVKPGDVVAHGSGTGNRAEVYTRGVEDRFPDRRGDVRYYGWCTYVPRDYRFIDTWQVVAQWKNRGSGNAPVYMLLQDERFELMVEQPDHLATSSLWNVPAVRGRWHSFVLRARWGPTAKSGRITLWHDGRLALPPTHRPTMHRDGSPNYWKLGLYRSSAIPFAQTVLHDGAVVAKRHRDAAICPRR